MKREKSLLQELRAFGLADGSHFIDPVKTPCDLDIEYDANLWRFAPGKKLKTVLTHAEASLLGLPAEIRLQILRHLLPDVVEYAIRDRFHRGRPHKEIRLLQDARRGIWHDLPVKKREQKLADWEEIVEVLYSPLRNDLEPCHVSIMRVNRQLYSESAQIVYENKVFNGMLARDILYMCGRQFSVSFRQSGWGLLESQLRHINDVRISVDASDAFCMKGPLGPHDCVRLGCHRLRIDSVRNVADFLAQSFGLNCLEVEIKSTEYALANKRRPVIKKEMRSAEKKILELARPFAMVRGLAYANFTLNGERPRDFQNSGAEFCNKLDTMTNLMKTNELAPGRTDLPLIKGALSEVFTAQLEWRDTMKQRFDVDVDELHEKCWQACEKNDKAQMRHQYRLLSEAWEEQKATINGLMEQIEEMSQDDDPVNAPTKPATRKSSAPEAWLTGR